MKEVKKEILFNAVEIGIELAKAGSYGHITTQTKDISVLHELMFKYGGKLEIKYEENFRFVWWKLKIENFLFSVLNSKL